MHGMHMTNLHMLANRSANTAEPLWPLGPLAPKVS